MGNGHPISAVVTTSEIATKFVEAEGLESLEEVNKLRRMGLLRWHIGPSENLGMNQGKLPDCRVGRWVVEGEGGEGKRRKRREGRGRGGREEKGGREGEMGRGIKGEHYKGGDLEPIAKAHMRLHISEYYRVSVTYTLTSLLLFLHHLSSSLPSLPVLQ